MVGVEVAFGVSVGVGVADGVDDAFGVEVSGALVFVFGGTYASMNILPISLGVYPLLSKASPA